MNEPASVIKLLRGDTRACAAIVNREWETQQAYDRLDAMDDDSLQSLKAQLLIDNPELTPILREANPHTSVMLRSLMVLHLKE